ncbi:MAG: endolytic transglycosylase MltG [Fermentimonas sp.]
MEQKKEKNKKRRTVAWVVIGLLVIGIVTIAIAYRAVFAPIEIADTEYIYIGEEDGYDDVVEQLKAVGAMPNETIFNIIAKRMKYPERVKTGRYAIDDGMTMPEIIRNLRSGNQSPVKLTFNNIRTMESLAGRLSKQLMMDSLSLLTQLNDTALMAKYGFNEQTFCSMFIPNTYEVYWDTPIENLLDRMKKEYDTFWNDNRLAKAKSIGLTPVEVSTLASIVEEEATFEDEYPIVARLYLNRINRGMRLEADPTVKFAVGDPTLRRILFKHLEVESPYNTYKIDGLPPGPIRIPGPQSIDATLSPATHNYLFMCAKADLSGRHNFSTTHAEHARNAAAYQRALNERGIF